MANSFRFTNLTRLRYTFIRRALDYYLENEHPPNDAIPDVWRTPFANIGIVLDVPDTDAMREWYVRFRRAFTIANTSNDFSSAQLRSLYGLIDDLDAIFDPERSERTAMLAEIDQARRAEQQRRRDLARSSIDRFRDGIEQIVDEYRAKMEITVPIDIEFSTTMTTALAKARMTARNTPNPKYSIRFGLDFLNTYFDTRPDLVRRVVGHEMAHIRCYVDGSINGHDWYFKSVCRRYGVPADTYMRI